MFDLGILALRLVLGAVFLGHGAQKAFGAFGGPGFDGATGFVGSLGFRPARVWAALAVGGELAAGFLFLLGLLTPLAGLLVLATMAVAIAKVHGPKGVFNQNGGFEEKPFLFVAPPGKGGVWAGGGFPAPPRGGGGGREGAGLPAPPLVSPPPCPAQGI